MKKTLILLIIILAIGASWSYGWHYVAGKVEEVIELGKTRLALQDKEFLCPGQEIGGYPFRINLSCAETSYFDNQQGFSLEAGTLRTAAQAYQPGKVVAELDGPAFMKLANQETFDLDWTSMRASVSAGFSGVEKFSSAGTNLSATPTRKNLDAFTIAELQMHGRKVEANDFDIAVRSHNVKSSNAVWPGFDLVLNVRLADIHNQLKRNPNLRRIVREQGLDGQINELRYTSSNGGEVLISGPMQVDRQGLVSGKFSVEVTQLAPIMRSLAKAFPQHREFLEKAEATASIMGGGQNGGSLKLPITIRDGKASLDPFPLGLVPPVF